MVEAWSLGCRVTLLLHGGSFTASAPYLGGDKQDWIVRVMLPAQQFSCVTCAHCHLGQSPSKFACMSQALCRCSCVVQALHMGYDRHPSGCLAVLHLCDKRPCWVLVCCYLRTQPSCRRCCFYPCAGGCRRASQLVGLPACEEVAAGC